MFLNRSSKFGSVSATIDVIILDGKKLSMIATNPYVVVFILSSSIRTTVLRQPPRPIKQTEPVLAMALYNQYRCVQTVPSSTKVG